ncbi:hypothetical protein B296_00020417 [Ensete ventricosum]|uniref:Uncharacterized protein n=1 Tax=Ensete ventricosum TaxID=4639 RepID=A0A426ZXP0_ENSVE|nr:hypothetical protein B296_00020417 [Ensete ventricosum]
MGAATVAVAPHVPTALLLLVVFCACELEEIEDDNQFAIWCLVLDSLVSLQLQPLPTLMLLLSSPYRASSSSTSIAASIINTTTTFTIAIAPISILQLPVIVASVIPYVDTLLSSLRQQPCLLATT